MKETGIILKAVIASLWHSLRTFYVNLKILNEDFSFRTEIKKKQYTSVKTINTVSATLSKIHYSKFAKQLSEYNTVWTNQLENSVANYKFRKYCKTGLGPKIACFGCSQTLGSYLNDNETWPFLLQEKLKYKFAISNYGIGGASMDTICRTIYTYLQKNTPDYIICLFPDIYRQEFYSMGDQHTINFTPHNLSPKGLKDLNIQKQYNAYQILYNDTTAFFNFVKNYKFIKCLCENKNIKLYWHTWGNSILYLPLDCLKKFIESDLKCIIKNNALYDINYVHSLYNLEDRAADGFHNGRQYNDILAFEFAKLILMNSEKGNNSRF